MKDTEISKRIWIDMEIPIEKWIKENGKGFHYYVGMGTGAPATRNRSCRRRHQSCKRKKKGSRRRRHRAELGPLGWSEEEWDEVFRQLGEQHSVAEAPCKNRCGPRAANNKMGLSSQPKRAANETLALSSASPDDASNSKISRAGLKGELGLLPGSDDQDPEWELPHMTRQSVIAALSLLFIVLALGSMGTRALSTGEAWVPCRCPAGEVRGREGGREGRKRERDRERARERRGKRERERERREKRKERREILISQISKTPQELELTHTPLLSPQCLQYPSDSFKCTNASTTRSPPPVGFQHGQVNRRIFETCPSRFTSWVRALISLACIVLVPLGYFLFRAMVSWMRACVIHVCM